VTIHVCVAHIPANFLPEVGFFSLTIKMKLAGKSARNTLRIPGETAFTDKSKRKMPSIPDEASLTGKSTCKIPAIPDEASLAGNTILCICLIFCEKFPVLRKTQYKLFYE
jgi:hypothetical protein